MLNRTNYTRNGHDWNPMPDMELESGGGGGGRIFGRGVREKGGSDEPPEPHWLWAWVSIRIALTTPEEAAAY